MQDPENILKNDREQNDSLLFINPSLDIKAYSREDRLRTYLSLGTLTSALRDQSFLRKYARLSGRSAGPAAPPDVNFSFDVRVLNLSLKPKNQGVREFFESYVRETGIHPRFDRNDGHQRPAGRGQGNRGCRRRIFP